VAPRNALILNVGFCVSTAAGSDDPCDVGIYDAAGNRLGSSGSTAGKLNSLGNKTIALQAPVQLVKGQVYYAAFACGAIGSTAASLVMTSMGGSSTIFGLFGNFLPQIEQSFQGIFPLPNPATLAGAITSAPIVALMET
jgi:hypothetical protein